MSRVVSLAVWAILARLLAVGQTLPDQTIPAVTVFLDFDSQPGTSSVEVMKKEVNDLFRPSGIRLDWRLTGENDGTETFSRLVVLRFKGRCRAEAAPAANDFGTVGEIDTLGSTEVAKGRVLPFSKVECDQVRKALSYLTPGADAGERQRALGMALGRVVAHELYHILARTTSHATGGLAKASQSLRDLIRPDGVEFLPKEAAAVHHAFYAE